MNTMTKLSPMGARVAQRLVAAASLLLFMALTKPAFAILNGQPDTTDTFVLGLTNSYLNVECTATLIAPNLAVATRHCIDKLTNTSSDCTTTRFYTETPSDAVYLEACSGVGSTCTLHRSYKFFRQANTSVCDGDIAAIVIGDPFAASEATPVEPFFSKDGQAIQTGQGVTAIGLGYGASTGPDASWGTRRTLSGITIQCVAATDPDHCAGFLEPGPLGMNEFGTSGGACRGDSGGPAMEATNTSSGAPPRVLGIVSRAEFVPRDCGASVYVSMDGARPLLVAAAQFAADHGGYPLPAWAGGGVVGDGGAECTVNGTNVCMPPPSPQPGHGCAAVPTRRGYEPWEIAGMGLLFAMLARFVRRRLT
jgi:hypothetical protein